MTATAGLSSVHPVVERSALLDRAIQLYAIAWIVFLIGGFRMPWEPIPLDDEVTFSGRRQLVFTLGGALALYRLVQVGRLENRLSIHLSWVLFSALVLSSMLWTTDRTLTLKRSIVHAFGVLLLIAAVDSHRHPVQYFLRTITIALGICAWISLAQQYVWPPNTWSIPWRPGLAGLSGHPNVLGPCMQVGFLLSLSQRAQMPSHQFVLRMLQLGMFVCLWKTDSMTSLTSTIIGTGIFVALATTSYRAGLIQLGIVFAAGVAMMIGTEELRAMFFASTGRDETLSGRAELWEAVMRETEDRPLLGTGFGAFWYEGRGVELVTTWNPRQSHNSWIDVIAELGYAGLLAFLVVVPLRLWWSWQEGRGVRGTRQRDCAAAIFASAVALLAFASRSESFFLRMDKLQWFATVWGLILLSNRGWNEPAYEFRHDRRRAKHDWVDGMHDPANASSTRA